MAYARVGTSATSPSNQRYKQVGQIRAAARDSSNEFEATTGYRYEKSQCITLALRAEGTGLYMLPCIAHNKQQCAPEMDKGEAVRIPVF